MFSAGLSKVSRVSKLFIYNINRFVLQECGDITWRVSDTVKNERELIAGDDGVCLGESNIYHQLVDFSIMGDLNRKVVIK